MTAEKEKNAAEPLAAEYYDQLLRLKAEFENFRKRADRERPRLIESGRWETLQKFLPVYDVLVKAHLEIQAHPAAGGLAAGMELIFKEFEKIFESEGVKAIEAAGKPFDPSLHEVLGVAERSDVPEGTVVEELQRGFTAKGFVLRAAKVRVARRPAGAAELPPPKGDLKMENQGGSLS